MSWHCLFCGGRDDGDGREWVNIFVTSTFDYRGNPDRQVNRVAHLDCCKKVFRDGQSKYLKNGSSCDFKEFDDLNKGL